MFRVGIITCSDKGFKGEREDISGKVIKDILEKNDYKVETYKIVPDDKEEIKKEMIYMSDSLKLDLILTTGGTGFSKRDVTPEATLEVIEKNANGISEAIRSYSLTITKRAMLSRAVSGIRGDTLIINMPGSPKAVEEALDYILDSVHHGLEILTENAHDCARK
ncbi:MogA/MoaB family molybdenum cofactor biosynthesis protein [Tissierella creatinophila]|uniref:Molybdenum cofactor biosynthesis protein B n=1 Tax=Tissierella creatinophila DSM 6911 TaxID=1123403 RepID=A0A1U7M8Y9_TISCR|nr:MogA/MoaB family molybdenum cofactor biosynthesis protein [Tissierella creatinophila]OLS03741.1 molybdopterin adenylyltransferase [Tissierella creatinophila DSM 6911]